MYIYIYMYTYTYTFIYQHVKVLCLGNVSIMWRGSWEMFIIIIIIVVVIALMQGIYNYVPKTNYVFRIYSVAAVL
jgi:hypothetical protein